MGAPLLSLCRSEIKMSEKQTWEKRDSHQVRTRHPKFTPGPSDICRAFEKVLDLVPANAGPVTRRSKVADARSFADEVGSFMGPPCLLSRWLYSGQGEFGQKQSYIDLFLYKTDWRSRDIVFFRQSRESSFVSE